MHLYIGWIISFPSLSAEGNLVVYYWHISSCSTVPCVCAFYFKDSIEANVESAEVHVQQANQQLSRAADYQVRLTVIHFLTA